MKNKLFAFMVAVAVLVFAGDVYKLIGESGREYPSRSINGYIAWGAGGATDNAARSITPLAQKYLGENIVLQNKPGATGAIATEYVYQEPADGYSLLYHAENPAIYGVMGISKIDYNHYEPVLLIGREVAVIVTAPDSQFNSVTQIIDYAHDNPDQLRLGTTGAGGLPFNVASMLSSTSNVTFNQIPFDGEGAALAALIGGHVDIAIANFSAAIELEKAGKIKIIAAMDNNHIEGYPHIEPIGKALPEYEKYFPWGAFYGVFVKKECPKEAIDALKEAFSKAYNEKKYQDYLKESYIVPMGISGDEAKDYITQWQQVSAWLLHDAGLTEISPEELGIDRVS